MRLIDLNLLLYAVNSEAAQHASAKKFLDDCFNGDESVGLPWTVLLGFLRISTRGGVFSRPLRLEDALLEVDTWLLQPGVVVPVPGDRHWSFLNTLLRKTGTAGNLTSDAHLAALALENDATLYSSDTDFGRFRPELRYINPLTA